MKKKKKKKKTPLVFPPPLSSALFLFSSSFREKKKEQKKREPTSTLSKPALPPRHHPPHVRLEPLGREPPLRRLPLDDAADGRAREHAVVSPGRDDVVGLADAVDVSEGSVDLCVCVWEGRERWYVFCFLVLVGGRRKGQGERGKEEEGEEVEKKERKKERTTIAKELGNCLYFFLFVSPHASFSFSL